LYIDLSIVSLTSCTIVGNEANPKEAGGISVASSSVSILLCTIEGNVAGSYGGGLVTGGNFDNSLLETSAQVGTEGIGTQLTGQSESMIAQLTISGSQVVGNTASAGSGGGIFVGQGSNGTITDTHFESNTASGGATSASVGGGGLAHTGGSDEDALGLRLILSGASFSDNVDENDAQAHDLFSYNANTVVRETCPAEDGYYFLAQEGTALTVNEGGTASGTLSSFTCLAQCAPGEDRKTSNHPCTVCEAGKYGNSGIFECSECPAGAYNEDTGAISLAECAACSPGSCVLSSPSCPPPL
jgi:hypothetical protein